MALACPNIFDELSRIRTASVPFDPNHDHTTIVAQLRESCLSHGFLAAAPQNLVEPAELLSVIVVRAAAQTPAFLNPRIVYAGGSRIQIDACGNVHLIRDGERVAPIVEVKRPSKMITELFVA